MSDTDQQREDEVLRRMLNTPPTPHKPKGVSEVAKRKPGEPDHLIADLIELNRQEQRAAKQKPDQPAKS